MKARLTIVSILIFVIILSLLTIEKPNKWKGENINVGSIIENTTITDYSLFIGEDKSINIMYQVDNTFEKYSECIVVDENNNEIKNSNCFTPMATKIGIIKLDREYEKIKVLIYNEEDTTDLFNTYILNLIDVSKHKTSMNKIIYTNEEIEQLKVTSFESFVKRNKEKYSRTFEPYYFDVSAMNEKIKGLENNIKNEKDELIKNDMLTDLRNTKIEKDELIKDFKNKYGKHLKILKMDLPK